MSQKQFLSTVGVKDKTSELGRLATLRRVAGVFAIAMVLPAIGMIVDGFAYGRPLLGFLGLALTAGLGVGYYLVLKGVLQRASD